jgi:hypothetical protein
MSDLNSKRLGVTVMPEYIQSEGIDAVLYNIADRLGATSVTTCPYVAKEGAPGQGFREPPIDAGAGGLRLLDRPLWRKREVYVESAPSFRPDNRLYEQSNYAPEKPTDLTDACGHVIGDFFGAAKAKGLTTYLQIMSAIPPCLRVQMGEPYPADQPLLPDGTFVPKRVDRNASLAAQNPRNYLRALIKDLCLNYPDCDGFKFDWPEYPPYDFNSLFADYNPQVAPYASELGLHLSSLADGVLEATGAFKAADYEWTGASTASFKDVFVALKARFQAVDDHFRLREHLVGNYAQFLRECVDEASGGTKRVFLQGFPPPWNALSGFNPKVVRQHTHELGIKFYTMHWPMIGANYVEQASRKFDIPRDVSAAFFRANFMGQKSGTEDSAALSYPEPNVPHRISQEMIQSTYQSFGDDRTIGIAHCYGPCYDVVERCTALLAASHGNIELNRYGYLGEDKMDALASLFAST